MPTADFKPYRITVHVQAIKLRNDGGVNGVEVYSEMELYHDYATAEDMARGQSQLMATLAGVEASIRALS